MKEIKDLLEVTNVLRTKYARWSKQFTLDGKLVGDIGEVLAAEKYGLELYRENTTVHDGYEIVTGKKVQIKATMKGGCNFPFVHVPDYFLVVFVCEDGTIEEIYNGTGQFLKENYVEKRNRRPFKEYYYTLSRKIMEEINEMPENVDKIHTR
jgi:hypothetical protein